jgi:prepilin-type N-terminal cleavage/methylation domain-containing protein
MGFLLRISVNSMTKFNSGFTLIEMGVVIMIIGVMTAMAISFAGPVFESAKRIETNEKIRIISKALSEYAVQNNRIPCPAAPNFATTNPRFGFEIGSGAAGDQVPNNCTTTATNWEGIVPFKTLGLSDDIARDGWGEFFTYAISPNFGQNPRIHNDPLVHALCRTRDWYVQAGANRTDVRNKNFQKAAFCCGYMNNDAAYPGWETGDFQPGTDLIIQNEENPPRTISPTRSPISTTMRPIDGTATLLPQERNVDFSHTPFADLNPNQFVPADNRPTAAVYVLVSHGKNRIRIWNMAGGRNAVGGTTDEQENADGDRTFVQFAAIRDETATENAYDDVSYWATQDMIFFTSGKSCSVP